MDFLVNLFRRPLARPKLIKPFRTLQHRSYSRARAFLHAMHLRLMTRCGFVVVLVGAAGSGKTTISEMALPGRVVGPNFPERLFTPQPWFLDLDSLPKRAFCIDEAAAFDLVGNPEKLAMLLQRNVMFTVQSVYDIKRLKLEALLGDRLFVAYIGEGVQYKRECSAY